MKTGRYPGIGLAPWRPQMLKRKAGGTGGSRRPGPLFTAGQLGPCELVSWGCGWEWGFAGSREESSGRRPYGRWGKVTLQTG